MYSAYYFDFNGDFAHSKPRNQHAKGLCQEYISKQENDRWTYKTVMPNANQNSCDEMSWSASVRHVLVLISYVFPRMTKTHVACRSMISQRFSVNCEGATYSKSQPSNEPVVTFEYIMVVTFNRRGQYFSNFQRKLHSLPDLKDLLAHSHASGSAQTHPRECTEDRNDDQDVRNDTCDDNSGVVDGMVNEYVDDLEYEPTSCRE